MQMSNPKGACEEEERLRNYCNGIPFQNLVTIFDNATLLRTPLQTEKNTNLP